MSRNTVEKHVERELPRLDPHQQGDDLLHHVRGLDRAAFMLVIDTNVVSELMRERPNPDVLRWVDSQFTGNLFVTSVTEAEIRTGIAILPEDEFADRQDCLSVLIGGLDE